MDETLLRERLNQLKIIMNIILDLTSNYHVNVVLTGFAFVVSLFIVGAFVSQIRGGLAK